MPKNIYVDPTKSGTGNGLSPENAKKYYRDAVDAAVAGDTILFRRGYYHGVKLVSQDTPTLGGNAWVGLTLDAYGQGEGALALANPCIDGLTYESEDATGWTHVGSGVWKKAFGTSSPVARLFTGAYNRGLRIDDRFFGTAALRMPTYVNLVKINEDTLTEATVISKLTSGDGSVWYGARAVLNYNLYIYTGSTTVAPPAFYKGLSFVQSGTNTFGFTNGIRFLNPRNVVVRSIDVCGATSQPFSFSGSDTAQAVGDGVLMEYCNSYCSLSGMQFKAESPTVVPARVLLSNALARFCTFNSNSSEVEQELDNDKWTYLAAADMTTISGRVFNCRLEDCVMYDPYHGGMVIGGIASDSSRPEASGYARCTVIGSKWNAYCRGALAYNVAEGCFMKHNTFSGMNVRSQFSTNIRFEGNVSINYRRSIRKPGTEGWFSIESSWNDSGLTNIGAERYSKLWPEKLIIANNTFGPCYGTPIEIGAYDNGGPLGQTKFNMLKNTLTISNNVMLDTMPERKELPILTTFNHSTVTIEDQIMSSNAIYKADGAIPTTTIFGITKPVTESLWFSDSILEDHKLSENLEPMEDSPLIDAGKNFGVTADYFGKPYSDTPTVGAITRRRPARTTRVL